jgi:LmbE family N-acetylglucosaminyl deacetylase
MRRYNAAKHVLSILASPNSAIGSQLRTRLAIVVAHPDDETLGFGAQLRHFQDATVIVVTNGAPRDNLDARVRGYSDWVRYARIRLREFHTAMSLAGINPESLIALSIPDKEAAFHLPAIARRIADFFHEKSIEVVVTHAFEGGHADHDATAFAVHAAIALRRRLHAVNCDIVEMPFYYWKNGVFTAQRFVEQDGEVQVEIHLDAEAIEFKRTMLLAYESQADVIRNFAHNVERFRVATQRDFSRQPGGSDCGYYRITPMINFDKWVKLASTAATELQIVVTGN